MVSEFITVQFIINFVGLDPFMTSIQVASHALMFEGHFGNKQTHCKLLLDTLVTSRCIV